MAVVHGGHFILAPASLPVTITNCTNAVVASNFANFYDSATNAMATGSSAVVVENLSYYLHGGLPVATVCGHGSVCP